MLTFLLPTLAAYAYAWAYACIVSENTFHILLMVTMTVVIRVQCYFDDGNIDDESKVMMTVTIMEMTVSDEGDDDDDDDDDDNGGDDCGDDEEEEEDGQKKR